MTKIYAIVIGKLNQQYFSQKLYSNRGKALEALMVERAEFTNALTTSECYLEGDLIQFTTRGFYYDLQEHILN